jgi:hypothetical protein
MRQYLWPAIAAVLLLAMFGLLRPRSEAPVPAATSLPPEARTLDEDPPWYEREAQEAPPAFVQQPTADADEPPETTRPSPPPPAPALPTLDESDSEATAALRSAAGSTLVERFLVPKSVIRRLVATVDNAGRAHVSMKVRAVPAIDGRFVVRGSEDARFLDVANYTRYTLLVQLVDAVDAGQLVDAYQQYYPLLQEAFAELGYPNRQFHGRLVEVIDLLLSTPEVPGDIALLRPHVLYEFADPELEALASGQKALIRMGPRHAATIKAALSRLRDELLARSQAG